MRNDLDKVINHRMAIVSSLSRRLVYRIIAETGLDITPEQWTMLYYLWEENGLSIGDLVKRSRKDFANVTRIVEKLVRSDYVEKKRDADDSRSFRVYTLPKAIDVKKDVADIQKEILKISLQGIPDDEQMQVLHILDKMEGNIMMELER